MTPTPARHSASKTRVNALMPRADPPHKSLPPGGPRQRRDPVGEGEESLRCVALDSGFIRLRPAGFGGRPGMTVRNYFLLEIGT